MALEVLQNSTFAELGNLIVQFSFFGVALGSIFIIIVAPVSWSKIRYFFMAFLWHLQILRPGERFEVRPWSSKWQSQDPCNRFKKSWDRNWESWDWAESTYAGYMIHWNTGLQMILRNLVDAHKEGPADFFVGGGVGRILGCKDSGVSKWEQFPPAQVLLFCQAFPFSWVVEWPFVVAPVAEMIGWL